VPAAYRSLFAGAGALLASHRGYDAGALKLARDVARQLGAELVYATTTRLLVDLNRSARHRQAFSAITRALHTSERATILARYHTPYRERVERWIAREILAGRRVLHVSCHSFTPTLAGEVRRADVGLLYDPARPAEVAWARRWRALLLAAAPQLRVRRNYPYRGIADGLTSDLRKRFAPARYAGIELEVNQRVALGPPRRWRALRLALCRSLAKSVR
jgi:predicted N-formylglutamate amidohydrolase